MKGTVEFKRIADESAIAAINAKAVGDRFLFRWQDASPQEHATSFLVAKAMRRDILEIIGQAVRTAITEGRTPQQFADELTPLLQKAGWWGRKEMTDPSTGEVKLVELGSARRLGIIFDTNMRMAHAAGRWERFVGQAEAFPYLRYVAVQDGRTRPEHARWHGIILPVGDRFWQSHYPPNGWRCRCRVQQVSEAQMARNRWKVTPNDDLKARMGERTAALNTRTGQIEITWPGIDPGFAHNAGVVRLEVLAARAQNRAVASANLQDAVQQFLPLPRTAWSWAAGGQFTGPLDLSGGGLANDLPDEVSPADILQLSEAHARRLLAGVPAVIPVKGRWMARRDQVTFEATTDHEDWDDYFRVSRTFSRSPAGQLSVEHYYFEIPDEFQQGGNGKAMMRAALALYDELGVSRVEVSTGLSQGGYVWARYGFRAVDDRSMRDRVRLTARNRLDESDFDLVDDVLETATPLRLMRSLAALRNEDGEQIGYRLLVDIGWKGYIDLSDPAHRALLEEALR